MLSAVLVVMAPAHAFAQQAPVAQAAPEATPVRERDHPEYDPRGMRFGNFNLNANLNVGAASTDNLFASPSSTAVDDRIFSLGSNVQLRSDWSRNALTLEAGGVFTKHQDFDREDANDYFARASGRIDVSSSTSLTGSAHVGHETTPRTDPDSPSIGKPVNYNIADASVGVRHRFAHSRISADVTQTKYDYHGPQNFRDNTETMLSARYVQDLSPALGVLVEATNDNRDYSNTPGLGSNAQTYLIGATFNGDLLRGEFALGEFTRDYKNAALHTFSGLAVEGNVQWLVTPLDTVTFDARRDANDQVGANSGLPYVTEQYGAHIDHELLRNVILSGGFENGSRKYDSISRTDDFTTANVTADYILNRRVSLNLRYDFSTVNSSGANAYRDYDVNTVLFSVGFHL